MMKNRNKCDGWHQPERKNNNNDRKKRSTIQEREDRLRDESRKGKQRAEMNMEERRMGKYTQFKEEQLQTHLSTNRRHNDEMPVQARI